MSPLPDWSSLIRQQRRSKKLSQRQLATRLGLDPATVSRWERGLHRPPDEMKVRLAEVLECSPDDLFPWAEAEVA